MKHGLRKDEGVRVWQNQLTPIEKVIADGCHLDRDIEYLVKQNFNHVTIEQFYLKKSLKIIGYMYR